MGTHAAGDGAAWASLEALDADQPHGLDYRESVHMAKAIRKRLDQEHTTFADSTVGGIHMPGGVAVLGMELTDDGGDITATIVGDGTYRARGLVWAWDGSSDARLWCSTKAAGNSTTGDWTLLVMHPDKQFGGGDITWAGGHEFDASVDISGNVAMDGDLTVDGKFAGGGDISIAGDLYVDGTADFSSIGVDGTATLADVSVSGWLGISGDFSVDGTAVLQDTVLTGDSTFTFDAIAGETGPIFKIFGDWSSRSQDTTYTARTDGIVTACISGPGIATSLAFETPAGTNRQVGYHAGGRYNISSPVKGGDTWAVVVDPTTATCAVLWLPFGDNT